jgi:hypothetical protein
MKSMKSVYVVLSLLWVLILAGHAQAANPLVTLKPGDSLTREFALFSQINYLNFSPAQAFLVIGTGDNTTKLGDLTIAIKSYVPSKDFGGDIDFSLKGLALPLSAGAVPSYIAMDGTVPVAATYPPVAATKAVKFNSLYGVAIVVIYIGKFDADTSGEPARFSVTFSIAAPVVPK